MTSVQLGLLTPLTIFNPVLTYQIGFRSKFYVDWYSQNKNCYVLDYEIFKKGLFHKVKNRLLGKHQNSPIFGIWTSQSSVKSQPIELKHSV